MLINDYTELFEFVGAKVLSYQEFGSYSGIWFAKVEYKSTVGWIEGSYGCCSGCDLIHDLLNKLQSSSKEECEMKYKEVGENYLDTILNQEDVESVIYSYSILEELSLIEEALSFVKQNKV